MAAVSSNDSTQAATIAVLTGAGMNADLFNLSLSDWSCHIDFTALVPKRRTHTVVPPIKIDQPV
jgi:hypothetical protein